MEDREKMELRKIEQSISELWENFKKLNTNVTGVPKKEERGDKKFK